MLPSDLEVEQAARDFRAGIDAAGLEPWALKHITYPRGACGHAAELLGRYLIERLGITADYVNQDASTDIGGWRHSHAWLEWNGLTIDISGDQFGWAPVIVTRAPQHHGRGEPQQPTPGMPGASTGMVVARVRSAMGRHPTSPAGLEWRLSLTRNSLPYADTVYPDRNFPTGY